MGKPIIVYTSQSGFTQQFAQWIARHVRCEVLDHKFVTAHDLTATNTLIYGGHLIAGRVNGWRRFAARYRGLLPKHLLVFGTGVVPPAKLDLTAAQISCATACETQRPAFFYFQGTADPQTLPWRLRLRFWRELRAQDREQTPGPVAVRPLLALLRALDHHDTP